MLLSIEEVSKHYRVATGPLRRRTGTVKAVDGVSFAIDAGQTFGLVGESGSGKSTLGRLVLHLEAATSGRVLLRGQELSGLSAKELRRRRRDLQVVLQDSYAALSPRRPVGASIREPLDAFGIGKRAERDKRVIGLLESVGLSADLRHRYPHELSGGQRQRVGIARAVALEPALIVADEPVSALDVSVRSQVIEVFMQMQREMGTAFLFISHDLSVVRQVSHVVGVLYLGKLVEIAECGEIFERPQHPYTRALLRAVPTGDPTRRIADRATTAVEPPSPFSPPNGCAYRNQCPSVMEACAEQPALYPVAGSTSAHRVACYLHGEPRKKGIDNE